MTHDQRLMSNAPSAEWVLTQRRKGAEGAKCWLMEAFPAETPRSEGRTVGAAELELGGPRGRHGECEWGIRPVTGGFGFPE
jgi:hypothetical protein